MSCDSSPLLSSPFPAALPWPPLRRTRKPSSSPTGPGSKPSWLLIPNPSIKSIGFVSLPRPVLGEEEEKGEGRRRGEGLTFMGMLLGCKWLIHQPPSLSPLLSLFWKEKGEWRRKEEEEKEKNLIGDKTPDFSHLPGNGLGCSYPIFFLFPEGVKYKTIHNGSTPKKCEKSGFLSPMSIVGNASNGELVRC